MHLAASGGHADFVVFLVEKGAQRDRRNQVCVCDITRSFKDNKTPLDVAFELGRDNCHVVLFNSCSHVDHGAIKKAYQSNACRRSSPLLSPRYLLPVDMAAFVAKSAQDDVIQNSLARVEREFAEYSRQFQAFPLASADARLRLVQLLVKVNDACAKYDAAFKSYNVLLDATYSTDRFNSVGDGTRALEYIKTLMECNGDVIKKNRLALDAIKKIKQTEVDELLSCCSPMTAVPSLSRLNRAVDECHNILISKSVSREVIEYLKVCKMPSNVMIRLKLRYVWSVSQTWNNKSQRASRTPKILVTDWSKLNLAVH